MRKRITKNCFNYHGEFQPTKYLAPCEQIFEISYTLKLNTQVSTENCIIIKSLIEKGFEFLFVDGWEESSLKIHLIKTDKKIDPSHILVSISKDITHIYYTIYHTSSDDNDCVKELINEFKPYVKTNDDSNKNKVNFIIKTNHGLELIEKDIKIYDVPLDNYELSTNYQQIVDNVKSEKPGLVIFDGEPGTGKSYFVRHLINNIDKKFVYIPVNIAEVLSDPGFINFAIEQLNNSILIIEDCEKVLEDRAISGNNATSTILNVTDGLLAELLNLKIIATVNVKDKIDNALLRKGRLLNKVTFSKLQSDKANKVLERLGKTERVSEAKVLTELYNIDCDNGSEEIIQKRKIGF